MIMDIVCLFVMEYDLSGFTPVLLLLLYISSTMIVRFGGWEFYFSKKEKEIL